MEGSSLKKIVMPVVIGLSFLAGVYFSDDLREQRAALFSYKARKGFYERPYNLRVVHRDFGNLTETYLLDTKTSEHHKIAPNMHIGDAKHRLRGVIGLYKEYLDRKDIEFIKRIGSYLIN